MIETTAKLANGMKIALTCMMCEGFAIGILHPCRTESDLVVQVLTRGQRYFQTIGAEIGKKITVIREVSDE